MEAPKKRIGGKGRHLSDELWVRDKDTSFSAELQAHGSAVDTSQALHAGHGVGEELQDNISRGAWSNSGVVSGGPVEISHGDPHPGGTLPSRDGSFALPMRCCPSSARRWRTLRYPDGIKTGGGQSTVQWGGLGRLALGIGGTVSPLRFPLF